ncbi:hypothetical protein LTR62_008264 [Meristemomyces frigidus]|uniref:Uncharacterized protein n=1 Tax=Meristemomyces frigidus TaxID=1508187 RepID=A0AAN7T9R1_9PEZI|nr:hypothetical protein LTR62_008264 [Meristemomyces frigidus]
MAEAAQQLANIASARIVRRHSFPVPEAGAYVPAITFFNPDTVEVDLDAQAKCYTYLSSTGLRGLVNLGTNAETFMLTREERRTLFLQAHQSVGEYYPIIAGEEAIQLQKTLSLAECPTKAGIANTKYAAANLTGPRAEIKNAAALLRPRRPYVEPTEQAKKRTRDTMTPIALLEDISDVVRESRL